MAIIKKLNDVEPQFGENCFLAENAVVIGDVVMGDECSIWYGAVLRGDVNSIRLGNRVNIQDNAVLHTLYQRSKVIMGNNITVGHSSVIHGATIHDNVLIGIGAIILDNAVINEGAIIAAGSVVLDGSIVEPGTLWAGVPAKMIKKVDAEQVEMIKKLASNYVMYAGWYK